YMLRHPETLLRSANRLSTLYNRLANIGPLRWLGEKTTGISKDRELPSVQRTTFAERFRSYSGGFSPHPGEGRSENKRGLTV
ncbi:MAG: hypothetical protein H6Q33_4730, partial [Deltaproteobacteria bacterium]|nr:hypothetical protein [Deltaproteobacteria bacterium]